MKNWKHAIYYSNPYLLASIGGALTVSQIAMSFFRYNHAGNEALRLLGWLILTAAAVFGWLPIFTFRRRGGVPKGKSYIQTTILVDSGIYAIVRHPQYLAGQLTNLALMLIAQHWLVAVLGVLPIGLTYLDALRADQDLIAKFGDEYRRYMQRVPGLNPLAGIVRLARRGETQLRQEEDHD